MKFLQIVKTVTLVSLVVLIALVAVAQAIKLSHNHPEVVEGATATITKAVDTSTEIVTESYRTVKQAVK